MPKYVAFIEPPLFWIGRGVWVCTRAEARRFSSVRAAKRAIAKERRDLMRYFLGAKVEEVEDAE